MLAENKSQGYLFHYLDPKKISEDDQKIIQEILENSFQKKLVTNYFKKPFRGIILNNEGSVAISEEYENYIYMDKIATVPDLQGNGLGSKLFDEVLNDAKGKSLFWRCNPKSSSNLMYLNKIQKNQGGVKFGEDWNVYWIGKVDLENILNYALNKKKTLL